MKKGFIKISASLMISIFIVLFNLLIYNVYPFLGKDLIFKLIGVWFIFGWIDKNI